MKTVHRIALTLLSAVLVLGLAACSSTQSTGEEIDDAGLVTKVKAKLAADSDINPFNIDVDVTDRVVTLSGHVDDAATRREAEQLARDTSGVARVINRIEIGEGPRTAEGDEHRDLSVVAEIKARFAADGAVDASDIDIDADEGVVTLSGTVSSSAERSEAERIARDTEGVARVVNRLEIR